MHCFEKGPAPKNNVRVASNMDLHGDLTVGVLDSRLIGQIRFKPWSGHYIVFIGKTFYSYSGSPHPGV